MGGRSGAARSGKEQQLEAFRGNQGAERQGAARSGTRPSHTCGEGIRRRGEHMHAERGCECRAPSHTCDPVSMLLRGEAVCVFQNRMHLSAVPPPEANNPF